MTDFKFGHIIANTRPNDVEVYLDGKPVLDSSGQIAKTPTMLLNVLEGIHTITFSKSGYDSTTISINVYENSYSDARAILNTQLIRYPMMLFPQLHQSFQPSLQQSLQPSPGWPTIPSEYIYYYGHIAIYSNPDGAEIYLDNQPVLDDIGSIATTPITLTNVPVGTHTITFKKQGYQDTSVRTFVQNGLVSDAFATLILLQSQYQYQQYQYQPSYQYQDLQYGLGDILVDSDPRGGYIYIDGIPQIDMQGRPALTPTRIAGVFQGLHEVQISLDRFYSKKIIINVIPDQVNNVFAKLQPNILSYQGIDNYELSNELQNAATMTNLMNTGRVCFTTYPEGASIIMDNMIVVDIDTKQHLQTPIWMDIYEGIHDFMLSKPGYCEVFDQIYVYPGNEYYIDKKLGICKTSTNR